VKIFLDTSPLIYLIEGTPENAGRSENQLRQWISSDATLSTSTLTLMELLIIPKRQKDSHLANKYRALILGLVSEPLIELNQGIAEKAAEIRADYGFKTPDSIQLATAVYSGADLFYTNDLKLKRFKELTILTID
jgi:predicted nucleic acid-binding protein